MIAAAVADPAVEFASNAGWFGRGSFTDRSNLDVVPALIVGAVFVALYSTLKLRVALRGRDPRRALADLSAETAGTRWLRFLAPAYALQIGVLYAMETCEQQVVWGHGLGGTVWMGAPVAASLLVHAAVCAIVCFASARAVAVLARATLRVLCVIRALATRALDPRPVGYRADRQSFDRQAPLLCRIGERAPPLLFA